MAAGSSLHPASVRRLRKCHLGNPALTSSLQPLRHAFAIEAGRLASDCGRRQVLKCIDVDGSEQAAIDLAGDQGNVLALIADVKRGSLRCKRVSGNQCGVTDPYFQSGAWVGRPDTGVSHAKNAGAGARGNRRRARFLRPVEREGNVATLALSGNQHANSWEGGKGLRMACKRIVGTAVDDPPAAAGSAPSRQVRYHFALCGRDPAVILPWICRNANQGFCAYV